MLIGISLSMLWIGRLFERSGWLFIFVSDVSG